MAVSPDGTRLAIAMSAAEEHQLYLRRFDRDELVPLAGTQGAEFPFFSPDGEWVGFWAGEQTAAGFSPRRHSCHSCGFTRCAVSRRRLGRAQHRVRAAGPRRALAGRRRERLGAAGDRARRRSRGIQPSLAAEPWRWSRVSLHGLAGSAPSGVPSARLHVVATGETRELVSGALYARYIGEGMLLFVRDGRRFRAVQSGAIGDRRRRASPQSPS